MSEFAKAAAGPILGAAMSIGAGKRQIKQQKKLTRIGIDAGKEMADHNKQNELDMWNATNYGAQIKHAKDAGMSISALYGGSGAGGTTTGGGGSGVAATGTADGEVARQGMGLQAASQLALLNAQRENIEADTENKKAAKTGTDATTEATQWQTELSKKLNTDTFIKDVQDNQAWATEKLNNENTKWKADWEAYQQGAYDGKQWDDPSTPMAKAVRAGFEETVERAEKAKADKNVAKAEAVIKGYEANLTKQGIAAGSPWYVKIMGDLLRKIGINLTGDTATAIK